MRHYFEPYFDVGPPSRRGLRARGEYVARESDLGSRLGYSLDELAEANRRCIAFVEEIRAREDEPAGPSWSAPCWVRR